MPVPSFAAASAPARRRRLGATALAAVGAALALSWRAAKPYTRGFVGARYARVRSPGAGVARRAGYAFDVATSEDHNGLMVSEGDKGTVISTHGGFMTGNWNTVLGDKELPAKGRHYWEVKIMSKPSDAWEYIGVAEPTADVSVPLVKNRKGKGYFYGANWKHSQIYRWLEVDTPKDQAYVKMIRAEWWDHVNDRCGPEWLEKRYKVKQDEIQKDIESQSTAGWTKGVHVGCEPDRFPPFKTGMVVGVDVDMDAGSISFWADGKYLGPVRDYTGKPLDLKGKKLVPAVSVFGRNTGRHEEYTQMEIRTGMEPPTRT